MNPAENFGKNIVLQTKVMKFIIKLEKLLSLSSIIGCVDTSNISETDLLSIPSGGVTLAGLELNIRVAIMFIHTWCHQSRGCFVMDGRAEDSATAEISRSQVILRF